MTTFKGITVTLNGNHVGLFNAIDDVKELTIAEQLDKQSLLLDAIEKETKSIKMDLLRLRLNDIREGLFDELMYEFDEPDLVIKIAEIIAGYN